MKRWCKTGDVYFDSDKVHVIGYSEDDVLKVNLNHYSIPVPEKEEETIINLFENQFNFYRINKNIWINLNKVRIFGDDDQYEQYTVGVDGTRYFVDDDKIDELEKKLFSL